MGIETDQIHAARKEDRDRALRELLRQVTSECYVVRGEMSTLLDGKARMYRLRFDILMALYQDVGW